MAKHKGGSAVKLIEENSTDIIDGETGEVMEMNEPNNDGMSTFDGPMDEIAKSLEFANTASDEQFQEEQRDFWKPQSPGDSFTGVYLETVNTGRIKQHVFAVAHKSTGKPYPLTVNGTIQLTKEIRKRMASIVDANGNVSVGDPRRLCKVTYLGETKTSGGNRCFNVQAKWFKPTA